MTGAKPGGGGGGSVKPQRLHSDVQEKGHYAVCMLQYDLWCAHTTQLLQKRTV